MNRNLLAFLLCISSFFAATLQSNGQSRLIHYWNFNHGTCGVMHTDTIHGIAADVSLIDTSKAKILYMESTGVSTSYTTYIDTVDATAGTPDYDTVNLRLGAATGAAIRTRNPSDSMELRFYIPTTNYKNIVLKFAFERTTNGAAMENYDYSIDSGVTWRTSGITTTADSPTYNYFSLFTEYFTDTQVNNNRKLVFRIKFSGGGVSTTSGNNRFDNVTVEGDTLIACTTPIAGVISGPSVVCTGSSVTLFVSGSGGTWSHTGSATSVTGASVSGVSVGVDTIKYTVTNSCGTAVARYVMTVSSPPSAGTIAGSYTVCQNDSTIFTDASTGGVWSTSNAAIATADPSTGAIYGVSGGGVFVSYSVTNSCATASATPHALTVNALPATGTITGTSTICVGATTTLTDAAGSGVWSSSSTGVATVNTTGVVTGLSGGTATISYTLTNSCGSASATDVVTINSVPNAGTITGRDTVCIGDTVYLSDAVSGGAWSSQTTSLANVFGAGLTIGFSAGVDSILYSVTGPCGTGHAAVALYVLSEVQCLHLAVPENTVANLALVVYPDPSTGAFTVELPVTASKTTISVMDLFGKTVATKTVQNTTGINENFNLSSLASGTYLVQVDADGQIFHSKFVKW